VSLLHEAVEQCCNEKRGRPEIGPESARRMLMQGRRYGLSGRSLCDEIGLHDSLSGRMLDEVVAIQGALRIPHRA
jgi:hypothetical protein